jgi:hypothetical protein
VVVVGLHMANVVMVAVEQQATVALAVVRKRLVELVHLQVTDIQEQMAPHTSVEIQKTKAAVVAAVSAVVAVVAITQLVVVVLAT